MNKFSIGEIVYILRFTNSGVTITESLLTKCTMRDYINGNNWTVKPIDFLYDYTYQAVITRRKDAYQYVLLQLEDVEQSIEERYIFTTHKYAHDYLSAYVQELTIED